VQRCYQLGTLKALLRKTAKSVSNEEIFEEFKKLNVTSGEKLTMSYVKTASTLWDQLFSVPRIKAGKLIPLAN